jgi:hypothetical protein
MLADSLTKASARADNLIQAVTTGNLLQVDVHPSFRSLIQHRAYTVNWCINNLKRSHDIATFFTEDIGEDIRQSWFVA